MTDSYGFVVLLYYKKLYIVEWVIKNEELEKTQKKLVVAFLKYYSLHYSGGTNKSLRSPTRDSTSAFPGYKLELTTLKLTRDIYFFSSHKDIKKCKIITKFQLLSNRQL
jgi:hypothetical protein